MAGEGEYVDCFLFPIATDAIPVYSEIAEAVARIWVEHGAVEYREFLGADLNFNRTLSFTSLLNTAEDETVIFGYVIFRSEKERNLAHKRVPSDPRMNKLVAPLMVGEKKIFDPERMAFGGFRKF